MLVRGEGEQALAVPLPVSLDALARGTAYTFGWIVYQETADAAKAQAEVTCAKRLLSAQLKQVGAAPQPGAAPR